MRDRGKQRGSRESSRLWPATRVVVAAAAVAALGGAPASARDHADGGGVFGPGLTVPNLGSAAHQQDSGLPASCDLPAKDSPAFKALGRNPGPSAVAHHGGGRPIGTPQATAPFPQVFPTGDIAIEPNIGVTSSGAVFVDVLRCRGVPGVDTPVVLRSTDQGQSWRDVSPTLSGQNSHQVTEDPYLYVDKRTDRIYTTDIETVVGCEPLSMSDDEGKTWTDTQTGCSLADHANIFTGPAPAGGPAPSGYPNAWYYCAIDAGAMAIVSKATGCVRSLDGGTTSVRSGEPAFVADPAIVAQNPAQCDGGTGPGFVDDKGTVYVPRGWCGQPYLAISHDEGQTWERVQVSKLGMGTQQDDKTAGILAYNHEAGVRVDREGNIFYVWVAHDRLPYLTVSHDGGKTWSTPTMIGPPGVRQAWNPTIDLSPGGRLAFGYLASTNAPGAPFPDAPEDIGRYRGATWNGYITITDDPLSPDPTFLTASVNAPDHPFIKLVPNGSSTQPIPCGQIRCGQEYDFIDLKMTRDGTPWAIYIDACGTGAKDCLSPDFGEAVAARLVTPGTAAALDAAGPALFGPSSATTPAPRLATPSAAKTCRSRRRFAVHVHRPRFVHLVSAQVYVNGRRVAVRRGRRLSAPVNLRDLPPGRFTVTIRARTTTGRTITGTRSYRTCEPTRRARRHSQ